MVRDWKAVSSRVVLVRLQCGNEKWVIVSAYGPGNEKNKDDRKWFWEALNECVSQIEQSVRMVLLSDMNARVGNMEMEELIGKFAVPGVNWAGEKMVEFCEESGLIVGNTWFKKLVNKCTWLRDSGTDEELRTGCWLIRD
jgi:hypothetical protein